VRPRRSRQGSLSLLAFALAIGAAACDSGPPAAPPAPAKAAPAAAPAKAASPEPAKAAPPAYAYEAKGRRDPFRPLIVPKVVVADDIKKPLCPPGSRDLRCLEVKDVKLVGIVWERRGYVALIEAPNGAGYVVRVNDTVGLDARVATITQGTIMFEVKPAVAAPSAQPRTVELRLRKEE
jgi:Tfp pilus assembly protein PilP